jgi:hypothetical protein
MSRLGSAAALFIALVVAALPCGRCDTIDQRRLGEIRQSAESLLSRISNLQMAYVSDWQADQQSGFLLRATAGSLKKLEERLATANNPKVRERLSATIQQYRSGRSSYECELTYAYPSMRLQVRRDRQDQEAPPETRGMPDTIWATNGSSFTAIDHRTRQAEKQSRVSDQSLRLFDRLPTAAIGLRSFPGPGRPDDRCLISLLSHPRITSIEGHELVEGVDTVILKVGPGIPAPDRPGFMGNGDYLKLWLAPSYSFLAIRKEYHFVGAPALDKAAVGTGTKVVDQVHCVALSDFRPVTDLARGNTKTRLPYLITYRDLAGTTSWRVSSMTINSPLAQDQFGPAIPRGFGVSVDGLPHKKYLSGGLAEKKRVVSESVTAARALLASSPPHAEPAFSSFQVGGAVALFCGISIVVLLVIRRKARHAF